MNDECDQIVEALLEPLAMFVLRDRMNAAVHCSPFRWSPVTLRLARVVYSIGVPADELKAMAAAPHGSGGEHYLADLETVGLVWPELADEIRCASSGLIPWPVGWITTESGGK